MISGLNWLSTGSAFAGEPDENLVLLGAFSGVVKVWPRGCSE
jgi:hypothetical protein